MTADMLLTIFYFTSGLGLDLELLASALASVSSS